MHYLITSRCSPFLLCNIRVYFVLDSLFYSFIVIVVVFVTIVLLLYLAALATNSVNTFGHSDTLFDDKGIILVFRVPAPLQNSKGSPSAGVLNMWGGRILQLSHLRNGMLLWITNKKSQVGD